MHNNNNYNNNNNVDVASMMTIMMKHNRKQRKTRFSLNGSMKFGPGEEVESEKSGVSNVHFACGPPTQSARPSKMYKMIQNPKMTTFLSD